MEYFLVVVVIVVSGVLYLALSGRRRHPASGLPATRSARPMKPKRSKRRRKKR